MRWDDVIRVRVPEPEELAEKERQKELAEKLRIQSGEKELNDLQTKLADCFLNSWIFAAGEVLDRNENQLGSLAKPLLHTLERL